MNLVYSKYLLGMQFLFIDRVPLFPSSSLRSFRPQNMNALSLFCGSQQPPSPWSPHTGDQEDRPTAISAEGAMARRVHTYYHFFHE